MTFEEILEYNVSYFQIVINLPMYSNVPISSEIETREEARRLMPIVLAEYPDAQMGEYTFVFVNEEDSGRAEMLDRIKQPTTLTRPAQHHYDFSDQKVAEKTAANCST